MQRQRDAYAMADHVEVSFRWISWSERTSSDLARLRMQRQRLRERIQPREPARSTDPWVIALEALQALEHVEHGGKERIAESIRRLAWGPDE